INGVAVSFAREHAREDRRRCARRADGDRRQLALRLVRLELHHVAMVLAIRRLVGLLRSRRTGYDSADRRGRRAIQGGNRMEWWQALGMLIVAVLIAVLIIEWQGQPMEWWQYLLGILIALIGVAITPRWPGDCHVSAMLHLIFALVVTLVWYPAGAATIVHDKDRLVLTGPIRWGDNVAFFAAVNSGRNIKTVVLNSDGGTVDEG